MDDHVRASDQDRDRSAQTLREHFATGRISQEELDERVQAAYRASTQRELRALTADLPLLPVSPQEARAQLVARRAQLQRRLLQQTGGAIVPFAVCTVIWLASGARGQFWPIWVALVAIIPLLRGGWSLYGPAPDLERFERELEERERARGARRGGHRAPRDARRRSPGPPRPPRPPRL
jgi:hypothetical protein